MAASYSFSVSLRVWHPKMHLDVLTTLLRAKPNNSWRVGDPRKTAAGKSLNGLRTDNFWTARLINKRYATSPRQSLEPALAIASGKLAEHRALFRRIVVRHDA